MQLWTSSHGAVGKPLARSGEWGSEAGLRLSRQDPRVCAGDSQELETETRCQNAEAWGHVGTGLSQASVPSLPSPLFPACPAPVPRRVSLGSESRWGEETAASCLQACACQAPRGQPAHLASLGELKGHPFLAGLRATPSRNPIGWERNQTPCSAGPLRPWLQCLRGKGGHGSGGKALTWPCSSGV